MKFDQAGSSAGRSPILAHNVVATSQPLAAQAGVQMLKAGGNAVDAAVASAIALTVVEPTGNGVGSDAFAIIWDGQKLRGFNGSGRSPVAWNPAYFKGFDDMPRTGWNSVTVPGAVDTWINLSKRFGKLPFGDLFEPAIRYASDGFLVTPRIAAGWQAAALSFGHLNEFRETFLPFGRAPKTGERFRCEPLAKTLTKIALTEGESFYRGELAEAITSHAQSQNGAMRIADLNNHQGEWVDCINQQYHNINVHEIPPNGQGLAALIALGVLQNFDLAALNTDSLESVHLQIEAMKIAFADAHRHIGDPTTMKLSPQTLLDVDYLAKRATEIDINHANNHRVNIKTDHGTVYLSSADADGMMVSYIQSNYEGFGSGVVIPGCGISMQNRGAGFVLENDHPNQVVGGKRPFHTIIPAFASRDDQPLISFGVMGGHMQPQGHVQVLLHLLHQLANPQAALDAPRWHVTPDFDVVLESQLQRTLGEGLAKRGHKIIDSSDPGLFGGGQIIYRLEDGYCAGSDFRKDGQAIGF